MKHLKISSAVSLPLDAVTQTFAILAVKGSGKSYTASVMAEEMLKAGQPIVVLDITGAWYGLKSSADGKSEGFPVAIFGGDHADVPLEENAGEIIAQAIVEQRFSAIIDLSLFRKNQVIRFLAPFLETLYRLNREPLHLFADEADAYVPQKVFGENARTVGAMEDIVRRGRKKGIGCTLITQRPASINKDVLTQCEILIALRMSHPRDMAAIKEWVDVHATIDEAKKMIENLPTMPTGSAYIWSPSWLKVFQFIDIRKRETFDSGATPKPGEKIVQPKKLAPIDIEKLGAQIKETVERKKADDPRELKRQIADLKKAQPQTDSYDKLMKEHNILLTRYNALQSNVEYFRKQLQSIYIWAAKWQNAWEQVENMMGKMPQINPVFVPKEEAGVIVNKSRAVGPTVQYKMPGEVETRIKSLASIPPKATAVSTNNGVLTGPERKILTALAQANKPLLKKQLAIRAGYDMNGGGFNNPLGRLRTSGYAEGTQSIQITPAGIAALGSFEPLPTGAQLCEYWLNHLPKPASKILSVLIEKYPEAVSKNALAGLAGYEVTGGGFNNPLGRLRTLELAEGYDPIKASDSLFN